MRCVICGEEAKEVYIQKGQEQSLMANEGFCVPCLQKGTKDTGGITLGALEKAAQYIEDAQTFLSAEGDPLVGTPEDLADTAKRTLAGVYSLVSTAIGMKQQEERDRYDR